MHNIQQQIRRTIDPIFIVRECLQQHLSKNMLYIPNDVNYTTYLGCSLDKFIDWIEFQFENNMSWNNHGEWHFDHVLPISSFNLNNDEERAKCYNWQNIRPIWKVHNLNKKNKILVDEIAD